MTFVSLATAILVPPVNLAVLAALALLAGRRRLAGAAMAGLLLLATPLVADGLMAGLERGQGPTPGTGQAGAQPGVQPGGQPGGQPEGQPGVEPAPEAIVVLGAEVIQQADGATVPGVLTLQRLRTAAAMARQTGLPLLVTGGVTTPGAEPVAVAMAGSLRVDFAMPARWVEVRAADTFENARNSAALLAQDGVRSVLLVTHRWHMRRALLACRAAGLHAVPAPVPEGFAAGTGLEDLVPRPSAWLRSYYALHEWIGLGWYTLRAWAGA